ncbi:MAG: cyclic nucleotide-binding protein [Acidimicrobiales bacterium]|nr:cyclic nucleotide-binding protein [Acidimicrobiales bacterium]
MRISRAIRSDPKAAVLRSVLGLRGASERDVLVLASLFDEASLDEGEILIREGEPGREVFLILEGQVAVSLRHDTIATIGPGQFVGEMSLFQRAPRSATVMALTPIRTLVAGTRSFATLLNDPVMLRRLATTLAQRLRAAQGSPPDWLTHVA